MGTKGITGREPDPWTVYADIIDLPRHQSPTRPHMSLYDRAAQFSAFDALAGYSDMVAEEARLTDRKTEPGEHALDLLNRKLNLISDEIAAGHHPEITVRYFEPDERKNGGRYQSCTGHVKQVDRLERKLVFFAPGRRANGETIDLDQVAELHGTLLHPIDCKMELP